ncbi:GL15329 [Drosophila persimilis]|uniref:GL15329 n=1 Tax=Drosophila persimilis TaxID=7234 RepID=B4H9F4_DROPE|nr:GL15329 [Drosophila persimilis]
MSMPTRALVFSTFFGICLAIGLQLVSMTTNHWHLSLGFGVRIYRVDSDDENGDISFWLWLLTTLGTGFGLLACAVAAFAAVLKSASAAKRGSTMVLPLTANISAAGAQVVACVAWLVQFYHYLIHNVLLTEHQQQHWYSTGLASLGYSFCLVVISTNVVLLNITILRYARRRESRDRRLRLEPESKDKHQAAIILY